MFSSLFCIFLPGGQSASVLGASLEVLERSTGISISTLGFGGGGAFTGFGSGVCFGAIDGLRVGFRSKPAAWKFDLRILSIENVKGFDEGGEGWGRGSRGRGILKKGRKRKGFGIWWIGGGDDKVDPEEE